MVHPVAGLHPPGQQLDRPVAAGRGVPGDHDRLVVAEIVEPLPEYWIAGSASPGGSRPRRWRGRPPRPGGRRSRHRRKTLGDDALSADSEASSSMVSRTQCRPRPDAGRWWLVQRRRRPRVVGGFDVVGALDLGVHVVQVLAHHEVGHVGLGHQVVGPPGTSASAGRPTPRRCRPPRWRDRRRRGCPRSAAPRPRPSRRRTSPGRSSRRGAPDHDRSASHRSSPRRRSVRGLSPKTLRYAASTG